MSIFSFFKVCKDTIEKESSATFFFFSLVEDVAPCFVLLLFVFNMQPLTLGKKFARFMLP